MYAKGKKLPSPESVLTDAVLEDFDRRFGDLFGGKQGINSMAKKLRRPAKTRSKNSGQKQGGGNPQRLFTIKEAAAYLGRSEYSLRTLIWDGVLPVVRHGRKMWLDLDDLHGYIKSFKRVEIG